MNREKFENELKIQLSSNSVDISFLRRWFDKTLESLRSISEQRSEISHPRHRGDAREIDIQGVFEKIFPDALPLRKGFVLNSHTTVSREQDIIVTSGDTAGTLIQAGEVSYFPIESCLASIEVKSNLTLPEIRKSIISCVSVKKLLYGDGFSNERADEQKDEFCYAIFSYGYSKSLSHAAEQFNTLLSDVPFHLRPNLIYILGKGLLIPGHEAGLELKYEQMFYQGEFRALPSLGTAFIKKTESYAFLWYVTSIIDHCLNEKSNRKPPSYLSYIVNPICFQSLFERKIKEENHEQYQSIIKNLTESGEI
ncbi:DUF6602 domain-containing protein [Zobellella iuensis]|uniref:DUF6602 domain-containing protein n=1 Tax=Zobellella iuensis TaxID=2803811 RepID=A0ABS1QQ05_9GAMM|nr:DUF6602 domain-containing protein [Zobellella iuensis]MBL1376947.1 hypothetical protein [Zobellella iuensis]